MSTEKTKTSGGGALPKKNDKEPTRENILANLPTRGIRKKIRKETNTKEMREEIKVLNRISDGKVLPLIASQPLPKIIVHRPSIMKDLPIQNKTKNIKLKIATSEKTTQTTIS